MKTLPLRYGVALLVALLYPFIALLLSPLTVVASFFILHFFYDVSRSGNILVINTVPFVFISACTATLAYILLMELLLVTRGISLKKGMQMFLLGFATIFLMNILRIFLLVLLYFSFGKNYFDAVHIIFWQFVSTIFVALVWIALVEIYMVKTIPFYSDIQELLR